MTTPALILEFKKIFEALSAYGDEYEDVSRTGIDGHRQKYIGKRGKKTSISAISFHRDLPLANIAVTNYQNAKGKEAIIKNTLDGVQYQVFVHDVLCQPPKKISSSDPLVTYQVRLQLEVTRTA